MKIAVTLLVALAVLLFVLYERPTVDYQWQLAADIPRPTVPKDNPMSAEKVALGRWLFYDTRLSVNQTMSCGTCHQQALAFTDGRTTAVGASGDLHPRAAMSLVNSAYASRLTWANPLLDRLEDQVLTPLFGDNPVEMGMGGRDHEIGALLESEPRYADLARSAFSRDENPYSVINAVRAIAAFTRSIASFDAPYDHYLAGDSEALNPSAIRGLALFFSERLECFHCHGGFNFTDSTSHANTRTESVGFHNTGLYNIGGEGRYPTDNTGLFDMTGSVRDMGRFKAPTLRNIAVTAPYMHDGSLQTLESVIDHYARGGRLVDTGGLSGDGRLSPFKSEFIAGFELSDQERDDLIAFLESLTDATVLHDKRWSNPFGN